MHFRVSQRGSGRNNFPLPLDSEPSLPWLSELLKLSVAQSEAKFRGGSMSQEISGIISWDPSVSKSNRLHADNFRLFFIDLRYKFKIPLQWWVIFLKSCYNYSFFLILALKSWTSVMALLVWPNQNSLLAWSKLWYPIGSRWGPDWESTPLLYILTTCHDLQVGS